MQSAAGRSNAVFCMAASPPRESCSRTVKRFRAAGRTWIQRELEACCNKSKPRSRISVHAGRWVGLGLVLACASVAHAVSTHAPVVVPRFDTKTIRQSTPVAGMQNTLVQMRVGPHTHTRTHARARTHTHKHTQHKHTGVDFVRELQPSKWINSDNFGAYWRANRRHSSFACDVNVRPFRKHRRLDENPGTTGADSFIRRTYVGESMCGDIYIDKQGYRTTITNGLCLWNHVTSTCTDCIHSC